MKIDAPKFRISARAIDIFKTPDEFYSELKRSILAAKKRIFLATLYIGSKEHELVETLATKLAENRDIKVHILSDGLRGTREFPKGPSTASLLSPLITKFPGQVTISMYRTPAFKGIAKLLPKRFNEGCGLQHMKLYGVDDEIVLSGANLSTDYFTDRQDRYIRIRDARVTQHFWKLFEGVADLSYTITPTASKGHDNFKLVWPHKFTREEIPREAQKLQKLIDSNHSEGEGDTVVYPIVSFVPLGLGNEKSVMETLCGSGHPFTLTAGYFNIAERLKRALFKSKAPGTVIVAAPEANGFFESKGVSGNVPTLYSMLAEKFAKQVQEQNLPIQMVEWKNGVVNKGGWSYHAKGLWLHGDDGLPFLTVIGSSNYTKRSYRHDIEAGAVIDTTNEELRRQLKDEIDHLQAHTCAMTSRPSTVIQRVFVKLFSDRL